VLDQTMIWVDEMINRCTVYLAGHSRGGQLNRHAGCFEGSDCGPALRQSDGFAGFFCFASQISSSGMAASWSSCVSAPRLSAATGNAASFMKPAAIGIAHPARVPRTLGPDFVNRALDLAFVL
jgi:hypothetical protein